MIKLELMIQNPKVSTIRWLAKTSSEEPSECRDQHQEIACVEMSLLSRIYTKTSPAVQSGIAVKALAIIKIPTQTRKRSMLCIPRCQGKDPDSR